MFKTSDFTHAITWRVFRFPILVASLVLTLTLGASGQTSTTTSATDGSTPSALTPGAPAGSYALSGFDSVHPFNGNLNFSLPLVHIVGRGDAQYTMTLPMDTNRWRVQHTTVPSGCGPSGCQTINHLYHADFAWWNPSSPGYGPGVLRARRTGDTPQTLSGCTYNSRTMTRLTFTAPDGTEFELIDQANGGKPLTATSCFSSPSRGTVFVTTDGTSASFVSDSVIFDTPTPGVDLPYVSGFLMFRNGVRYRIDSSNVTWIRDRNGNMLNFTTVNGVYTITDSLGRVVTVTYNRTDANGVYDEIAFKGFGRAQRTIQVRFKSLGGSFPDGTTVLRPGYSLQSPAQLFPPVLNSSSSPHNPTLATAVILPDGRQYRFRYNPYAELWRVELPTGGAFEYEGGPGFGTYSTGVTGSATQQGGGELGIHRRVTERRVYPDGVTLEGKMVYTGTNGSVTIDHQDPGGNSLGKDEHHFVGSPISRLTDPQTYTATQHEPWDTGKEVMTKLYDKLNGAQLRQVDNTWSQSPPSWWTDAPGLAPPNNPVLTEVVTTLTDVTPNLVRKQHYGYDPQFFNQNLVEEYDFGSGAAGAKLRSTETLYATSGNYTNPGADPTQNQYLRSLPSIVTVKDGNGTQKAQTTIEYDNYNVDAFHSSLVGRSSISGLDSGYLDPTTGTSRRGNPTKVSRWLDTTGGTIDSYNQYDVAGNVIKVIDPRSTTTNIIATTVDFTDDYGAPNGDARQNTAPPELETQTSYAFPTKVTNAMGHTAYGQFDYYLGRPVDGEDADNLVASGYYQDALDRPTMIIRGSDPASSSLANRIVFTYSPSAVGGSITTNSDKDSFADGVLTSTVLYDGLGRTTETQQFAPEGVIRSTTTYDALGRTKRATNPYRSTSEPTYGYTESTYDGLSRVKTFSTFDGGGAPTGTLTTSYAGNATTVVDQALKQRRSVTDALDRLTSVDEMLEYPSTTVYATTTYLYNPLDDLTTVTQGSQPQRTFVYDSLKRLKQAFNPESGPVNYTYDENSNLKTKTDARNIITTYNYDQINRVISRVYSGDPQNTQPVFYFYDSQGLPAGYPALFNRGSSTGRLVAVTYGSGSAGAYTGYDRLGRVTTSFQQTDGQNYQMGYSYNLSGAMTSETYPSNRVVSMNYDTTGRPTSTTGQKTGEINKTYASSLSYAAHGAVASMLLGNGKWAHTDFNSRLQPLKIGLGTSATDSTVLELNYTYGTISNNGNVLSQRLLIAGVGGMDAKQNYTYDPLNRLATATEIRTSDSAQQWMQMYDYDRYGNRAVRNTSFIPTPRQTPVSSSPADLPLLFNQSNNRIIATTEYGYDAAGNLTSMPNKVSGADTMTYDAENRVTKFNTTVGQYSYDGDGHRVKKIDANGTTVFVYNAAGQLVAEYTTNTPTGPTVTSYLTSDHLGSTRVVTKQDGTVKARYDYLPFGEELGAGVGQRTTGMGYSSTDLTRQKFTQKERDIESGLDYFGARYFSSASARFTSPDPMMASGRAMRPESWNRYSYVLNNPLGLTDSTGLEEEDTKKKKKRKAAVIIIGGGPGSADAAADKSAQPVSAGGSTQGLGEADLTNYEAQAIAAQIKNDFPEAEVILSGPNGINALATDLVQNPPENILMYGYSMGATSALGVANVITNNGVSIDQLTTVDPPGMSIGGWLLAGTRLLPGNGSTQMGTALSDIKNSRFVVSSNSLSNPNMIRDALNYVGPLGHSVTGARNEAVTQDMATRPGSDAGNHRHVDDITSGRVVQRMESRLSQIFNRPQKQ